MNFAALLSQTSLKSKTTRRGLASPEVQVKAKDGRRRNFLARWCAAFEGGDATAHALAVKLGRSASSVNSQLYVFRKQGVVVKVGELPNNSSGYPTYIYRWQGEPECPLMRS